jgi:magnesium transporter
MVKELSFVRRDIIAMRRIIKPNIAVVRSLEMRERAFLRLDNEDYFGDLTDGLAKLWDMLEEQKELVEGLDATLDSLTSHRINEEMKIFTLISVIMLPMTLVASILGMNVTLPFSDHPLALPVSLIIMVSLGLGMFLYFRYKDWV